MRIHTTPVLLDFQFFLRTTIYAIYNQLQQIKLFNKALDIFTQRALKTENEEEQTAMLLRAMKVIESEK